MVTIAIAAQKGGVGKTATAAALGAAMKLQGLSVLYVDLDPQANLTAQLLGDQAAAPTVTDILTGRAKAAAALHDTEYGAIIPANSRLAEKGIADRITALRDALEPLKRRFDVCFIDCPPSLGALTLAALTACNGVIIPAKADRFSMDSVAEIAATIETTRQRSNPGIKVYGVIVTMFNPRTTVNKYTLEALTETAHNYGMMVYEPPIRRAIAVEETQYTGGSIFDSKNNAAADYAAVAKTIKKQITKPL